MRSKPNICWLLAAASPQLGSSACLLPLCLQANCCGYARSCTSSAHPFSHAALPFVRLIVPDAFSAEAAQSLFSLCFLLPPGDLSRCCRLPAVRLFLQSKS